MRLSSLAIRAVAAVVRGDVPPGLEAPVSPYRTHERLTEFFFEQLELPKELDPGGGRRARSEGVLKSKDDSHWRRIIEAAVKPVDFVNTVFDPAVAVEYLNESLKYDGLVLRAANKAYALFGTGSGGVELPSREEQLEVLSEEYVQELADKSSTRLASGDVDGAVTVARTHLEAVLRELEFQLMGTRTDFAGELQKQFKHVARALNLDDERKDLDDGYKQVVRGLVGAVNGIAPLRNRVSDSHARVRKPAPHHGQLVVNAARTVSLFLVQSFLAQLAAGKLKRAEDSGARVAPPRAPARAAAATAAR